MLPLTIQQCRVYRGQEMMKYELHQLPPRDKTVKETVLITLGSIFNILYMRCSPGKPMGTSQPYELGQRAWSAVKSTYNTHLRHGLDIFRANSWLGCTKATESKLEDHGAIGGWNASTSRFQRMSSTNANRATFINSLIAHMQTHSLDGFDLDWEYPTAADKNNLSALLRVRKESIKY